MPPLIRRSYQTAGVPSSSCVPCAPESPPLPHHDTARLPRLQRQRSGRSFSRPTPVSPLRLRRCCSLYVLIECSLGCMLPLCADRVLARMQTLFYTRTRSVLAPSTRLATQYALLWTQISAPPCLNFAG
eukprot:2585250-Rhodomonas_salina.1